MSASRAGACSPTPEGDQQPMTAFGRKRWIGKKCSAQGKRKFRSSVDALIDHADNPRSVRAYLCPACGFWHVATRREGEAA